MPLVTVLDRPRGDPIATTDSPTLTLDESPTVTIGRFPRLILRTARSYAMSRPTICAETVSPLRSSTVIAPLVAAVAIT